MRILNLRPVFSLLLYTLNPLHNQLAWMKSRKSYCTTPGVSIGVGGGGVSKKFNVKVFYVMGKALSGELSCPCDRSCLINYNSISSMTEMAILFYYVFFITANSVEHQIVLEQMLSLYSGSTRLTSHE